MNMSKYSYDSLESGVLCLRLKVGRNFHVPGGVNAVRGGAVRCSRT
jgi:hypothetical protein